MISFTSGGAGFVDGFFGRLVSISGSGRSAPTGPPVLPTGPGSLSPSVPVRAVCPHRSHRSRSQPVAVRAVCPHRSTGRLSPPVSPPVPGRVRENGERADARRRVTHHRRSGADASPSHRARAGGGTPAGTLEINPPPSTQTPDHRRPKNRNVVKTFGPHPRRLLGNRIGLAPSSESRAVALNTGVRVSSAGKFRKTRDAPEYEQ